MLPEHSDSLQERRRAHAQEADQLLYCNAGYLKVGRALTCRIEQIGWLCVVAY